MMIDNKGCALMLAAAMAAGFMLGLVLTWLLALPWWVPIACGFAPVAAAFILLVAAVIGWMADGSH